MNDWKVWGSGTKPLAENLSRDEARTQVDQAHGKGDEDVYAESESLDETYPKDC